MFRFAASVRFAFTFAGDGLGDGTGVGVGDVSKSRRSCLCRHNGNRRREFYRFWWKTDRVVTDLVANACVKGLRSFRCICRHGKRDVEDRTSGVGFGIDAEVRVHLNLWPRPATRTNFERPFAKADTRRQRAPAPLRDRIHVPTALDRCGDLHRSRTASRYGRRTQHSSKARPDFAAKAADDMKITEAAAKSILLR